MPKPKAKRDLDTLTRGIISTGLEFTRPRGKKKKLRGGILGLIGLAATAIPLAMDLANASSENERRKAEEEQARRTEEQRIREEIEKQRELQRRKSSALSLREELEQAEQQSRGRQSSAAARRAENQRLQQEAEQSRIREQNAAFQTRQQMDRLRARSENDMYATEDLIAQTRARNQAALRRRQNDEFARDARHRQFELLQGRIQDQEETYANLFSIEKQQAIQRRKAQELAQTRSRIRHPPRVIEAISTAQRRR